MRYLTVAAILRISEEEVGPGLLMDRGRVEAAANRPMQSLGAHDAFPLIHDKAAALLHALVLGHPFSDGNKRTAWLAVRMFYGLNEWKLEAADDAVVAFLLTVARGECDVATCAEWLGAVASPNREDSQPGH